MKCELCGREIEAPDDIDDGRKVQCPLCEGKFFYKGLPSKEKAAALVQTVCIGCGSVFEVDEKYLGTRQKCVECGLEFTIWRYIPKAPMPSVVSPPVPQSSPRPQDSPQSGGSWSAYTPAAIAAAKNDAKERVPAECKRKVPEVKRRVRQQLWRRHWAKVRYSLAHHLLGVFFVAAVAFAGVWLKGKSVEMERRAQQTARDDAEAARRAEDSARKAELEKTELAQRRAKRLQEEFASIEAKFSEDYQLTHDSLRTLKESGSGWCAFSSYADAKIIYEVNAAPNGRMSIRSLRYGQEPRSESMAEFERRLGGEAHVIVSNGGKVWLNPMGNYDLPTGEGSFCVESAILGAFSGTGLAVNPTTIDMTKKFKICLKSRVRGNPRRSIVVGNFGYGEIVPVDRMKEAVANTINAKPGDVQVGRELSACRISVEPADDQEMPVFVSPETILPSMQIEDCPEIPVLSSERKPLKRDEEVFVVHAPEDFPRCVRPAGNDRTFDDCKSDIRALEKEAGDLKKEYNELKRKPMIRYTERHNAAGNIVKRVGNVIEVNKNFECGIRKGIYHTHANPQSWDDFTAACTRCRTKYLEWEDYVRQIPECEQRMGRLEEIKERREEIKGELSELEKERRQLLQGKDRHGNS